MMDVRNYTIINKEIVKIGDIVEYKGNLRLFNESQRPPIFGKYKLRKIHLRDIDVVFKGISNRKFFEFDSWNNGHIDRIKENFDRTPPVILEERGGLFYSIDGHHRITAASEIGLENILSFVIKIN